MEGYYNANNQQQQAYNNMEPSASVFPPAYYSERVGDNGVPQEAAFGRRRSHYEVQPTTSFDRSRTYFTERTPQKGNCTPKCRYYHQGQEAGEMGPNYCRQVTLDRPPAHSVTSNLRTMALILKELKDSVLKSNEKDKKIILKLQNDHLKTKVMLKELDEIRRENRELKDYLCRKFKLQYKGNYTGETDFFTEETNKYREVLNYYEGFLNLLHNKIMEADPCFFQNVEWRNQLLEVCNKLYDCQHLIGEYLEKCYISNQKCMRNFNLMKREKDNLKLAYDKMVDLFNKFNLESALELEMRKSIECNSSHRNIELKSQNSFLRQEVQYLRSRLKEHEEMKKWDQESPKK